MVSAKSAPKQTKVFYIDYSIPAGDELFSGSGFEKFLQEQIKVEGKKGALGDKVSVARKDNKIVVQANGEFSKRYLKYLTKKYLKKTEMRNWLRVIASSKDTYTIRFFNFEQQEE